ncbi:hypothetical protein R3P38DRAFT_2767614 [Favolaschia claudopus]|uniref:Uncharacterized protein n=1 Tax=Favolaschia claudopus TaxID=2862362 RepID=A0AAW0CUN3_9AGAR
MSAREAKWVIVGDKTHKDNDTIVRELLPTMIVSRLFAFIVESFTCVRVNYIAAWFGVIATAVNGSRRLAFALEFEIQGTSVMAVAEQRSPSAACNKMETYIGLLFEEVMTGAALAATVFSRTWMLTKQFHESEIIYEQHYEQPSIPTAILPLSLVLRLKKNLTGNCFQIVTNNIDQISVKQVAKIDAATVCADLVALYGIGSGLESNLSP